MLYLILAAVAGALPGIWAFFSHQVAFVLRFPNNTTDAVVHLVTAAADWSAGCADPSSHPGWTGGRASQLRSAILRINAVVQSVPTLARMSVAGWPVGAPEIMD